MFSQPSSNHDRRICTHWSRSTRVALAALLVSLSLWSAGCSSDGDNAAAGGSSSSGGSVATSGGTSSSGSGGASGGSGGASGGSGVQNFVGSFELTLTPADPVLGFPDSTSLVGHVYDRKPTRTDFVLKLDQEQDGCQLLVPISPFCDPECGSDAVCTADNVCTPQGIPQGVGDVSVHGLKSGEFTMPPTPPAFAYQPSGDVHLPYPPCDEDAEIHLEASDFSITGRCITPIALGGPDPISVSSGQALHLTWTAPANPDHSRVSIHLDLAHHGGKKGEINCDVPDTGSFDVPEPLMTRLISFGLAGFPTVEVARVSRASASAAAGIELVMKAGVTRALDTGVISCSEIEPCPSGQTCLENRTCK